MLNVLTACMEVGGADLSYPQGSCDGTIQSVLHPPKPRAKSESCDLKGVVALKKKEYSSGYISTSIFIVPR